jgi:2-C-methyl-D-erythritol 4-phosphate cytidylyltransferase
VGERAGTPGPKQYQRLGARTVVGHTLHALGRVSRLQIVSVVLAPSDKGFEAAAPDFAGRVARVGGPSRAHSVLAGLRELQAQGAQAADWVLVHDAARCLIRPEWVDRLIDACSGDDVGGLLAVPVADTLKREAAGRVSTTVDRAGLWAAQTPQMFRLGLLTQALESALSGGGLAEAIENRIDPPLPAESDATVTPLRRPPGRSTQADQLGDSSVPKGAKTS